ncbi:hypothetical protein V2J09_006261 [Rumex salicifolius]
MIDEKGKKWVLRTVNDLWRVYKSRLKEKHFTPYDTNEERLDHKPENIPINQFEELIDYWSSEQAKEISKNNRRSCELQDVVHTMGPSSFALLRTQLQKKYPNNQPPCEAKEEMDALQSTCVKDGDGSSCLKDPYGEVIKSDHLHLYGRTVTKSKLKEAAKDQGPSCILPSEFLESIKKELVQQTAPELISVLISTINAANTGVELNIPDFDLSSRDATTSIPHTPNEQPQDSVHRQSEENVTLTYKSVTIDLMGVIEASSWVLRSTYIHAIKEEVRYGSISIRAIREEKVRSGIKGFPCDN